MKRLPFQSVVARLVVLTLLPAISGCTSWTPRLPSWATESKPQESPKNTPVTPVAADLTPAQSASLCLKTADKMEQGGDRIGAVTFYEQARRLDPTAIDYSRKLANLYDQLDMNDQAHREYQTAIAATPDDADLLNDYGVFHLRREQWTESEVWFRKSLAARANHERAAINLAISLGMQNRLKESFELFHSQVGAASANSNLGVLLVRQGRNDEARHHFQQAIALDSSLESARLQLAQLEAAAQKQPSATETHPVRTVQHTDE